MAIAPDVHSNPAAQHEEPPDDSVSVLLSLHRRASLATLLHHLIAAVHHRLHFAAHSRHRAAAHHLLAILHAGLRAARSRHGATLHHAAALHASGPHRGARGRVLLGEGDWSDESPAED